MGARVTNLVKITKLKKISTQRGGVLHFLRSDDESFHGFGEVYFSQINYGQISEPKVHTKMLMNLVVPVGRVKFIFELDGKIQDVIIGANQYVRLTVPPGVRYKFFGLSNQASLIANFSNIIHCENEMIRG